MINFSECGVTADEINLGFHIHCRDHRLSFEKGQTVSFAYEGFTFLSPLLLVSSCSLNSQLRYSNRNCKKIQNRSRISASEPILTKILEILYFIRQNFYCFFVRKKFVEQEPDL